MTIEEKIKVIDDNQESIVEAINKQLDKIYNLTDEFFDDTGNLILGLEHNKKIEDFIKELRDDAQYYEDLKWKIIEQDFDLNLTEINRAALSLVYMTTVWKKQIDNLTEAISEANKLITQLMSKDTEQKD